MAMAASTLRPDTEMWCSESSQQSKRQSPLTVVLWMNDIVIFMQMHCELRIANCVAVLLHIVYTFWLCTQWKRIQIWNLWFRFSLCGHGMSHESTKKISPVWINKDSNGPRARSPRCYKLQVSSELRTIITSCHNGSLLTFATQVTKWATVFATEWKKHLNGPEWREGLSHGLAICDPIQLDMSHKNDCVQFKQ